jgi:hypothetical protein
VAVEIEGGRWIAGRHNSPQGFANDIEKYNIAALDGWLVLRVVPEWIDDGKCLPWIERALA